MNEQLASKLVEVIGAIAEQVGKVTDFAVEQLPDVAQQYIMYGRAISLFNVVTCLIVLLISIKLIVPTWKAGCKNEWIDFPGSFLASAMLMTISLFGLFVSMPKLLLVWFAPKVFLLQQLSNLIR